MNLVNEGVLPPNELDDRDERREEREMAKERETLADIVTEYRNDADAIDSGELYQPTTEYVRRLLDRIEEALKRERERDERLLFRLLWFDIEDYQSDWACKAYRQTIKDCCARLGIPYHESGKEIADEMDKSKLGVEVAREVYDE
jgi:hypothetical protein